MGDLLPPELFIIIIFILILLLFIIIIILFFVSPLSSPGRCGSKRCLSVSISLQCQRAHGAPPARTGRPGCFLPALLLLGFTTGCVSPLLLGDSYPMDVYVIMDMLPMKDKNYIHYLFKLQ